MYARKDLRVLKILQKAQQFADADLINENLLSQLIQTPIPNLSEEEKSKIIKILNDLIASKEKALLSK